MQHTRSRHDGDGRLNQMWLVVRPSSSVLSPIHISLVCFNLASVVASVPGLSAFPSSGAGWGNGPLYASVAEDALLPGGDDDKMPLTCGLVGDVSAEEEVEEVEEAGEVEKSGSTLVNSDARARWWSTGMGAVVDGMLLVSLMGSQKGGVERRGTTVKWRQKGLKEGERLLLPLGLNVGQKTASSFQPRQDFSDLTPSTDHDARWG